MSTTIEAISSAIDRFAAILRRRPDFALQQDTSATAVWTGGLSVVTSHQTGTQVVTDMPVELGGSGNGVSPGWMMRAGLASCAATRIAMAAAAEQITLAAIEVTTSSRSDVRGLLGITDDDGTAVASGPRDVEMIVRIAAPGIAPDRLRMLVETSQRSSPVSEALCHATPITLRVDIDSH